MEGLGINLNGLIAQAVNFFVLLLLLRFLLYKPVLKMLDERRQKVQEGLDQAEAAGRRAAEADAEFHKRLEEARKEAQAILGRATQMGEKMRDEALENSRREAQDIIEKARQEIGYERSRAQVELRDEVSRLAVLAAEKVVGQALDEPTHHKLIQDFISQVDQRP